MLVRHRLIRSSSCLCSWFMLGMLSPSPAAVEQEDELETMVVDPPLPHPTSSADASNHGEALALVPSPAIQGVTGGHTASTIPSSPAIVNPVLQDQEPVAPMYFEGGHYSLPNDDSHTRYRAILDADTGGSAEWSSRSSTYLCGLYVVLYSLSNGC